MVNFSSRPWSTMTTETSRPTEFFSRRLRASAFLPESAVRTVGDESRTRRAAGFISFWDLAPGQGLGEAFGFIAARNDAGVAKLRLCASFFVQDVMPTTSPRSFTIGPPLFPAEMGQDT